MKIIALIKVLMFLLIIVVSYKIGYSKNNNWVAIDSVRNYNPKYFGDWFRELKCVDSLNCFALVSYLSNERNGEYFKRSTNGGFHWETIRLDSGYKIDGYTVKNPVHVNGISYPSTNLIVAVGDSGLSLLSSNKGEKWERTILNKDYKIYDVFMNDESYGILTGSLHSNFKSSFSFETIDGCKSWNEIKPDNYLSSVQIFSNNNLCGMSFYYSKDGKYHTALIWAKDNWKKYDTLEYPRYMNCMHFPNENQGWMAGGKTVFDSAGWTKKSQLIYHTSDGGKTWEKQWDSISFHGEQLIDINFYDENFGIASSYLGEVIITTDGGKNWKKEIIDSLPKNDGNSYQVTMIQFLDKKTALVVCNYGVIYKYTRDPVGVDDNQALMKDFCISPNPAKDFIVISVPVGAQRAVPEQIRILDVFGQEVNNPLTPFAKGELGTSSSQFLILNSQLRVDVSALVPGLYFVRVGDRTGKFLKI